MFRHKEPLQDSSKGCKERSPSLFYRKMLDIAASYQKPSSNSKVSKFFDRLAEAELQKAERMQNGRFWKLAEDFSSAYMKFAEKKTKLLLKLGLDEQQLIEKLGVNRAFALAKLGSKLDIIHECASLFVGAVMGFCAAAISAAAIYAAAVQKDVQSMEHIFKTAVRLVSFTLPAAFALAPFFKALNWIGNTLDVLQHVLMDSISRKLNSSEARKHYANFCTESIREMMVDVVLGTIPIPLIDLLRRVRAIKLELRQLGHINRLEKLYASTQAKEAESNLPNQSAQVKQPE